MSRVFWYHCQTEPDGDTDDGWLYDSLHKALARAEAIHTLYSVDVDLYFGEVHRTFHLALNAPALFFLIREEINALVEDGVPMSEIEWAEDVDLTGPLFEAAGFESARYFDTHTEHDLWYADPGFSEAIRKWYFDFEPPSTVVPDYTRYFAGMSYGITGGQRSAMEAWRQAVSARAEAIEHEFNLRCDIVREEVLITTIGG